MSDSKKASYRPDRSELHHLYNSQTMQWMLECIRKTFPARPASVPPKALEQAYQEAGQQQVIEYLYKLLRDGDAER